jgi:hypothetical protein
MKRIHRRAAEAALRVVFDPTGDFAGPLRHVRETLALGYFPPGLIVAQAGKQYVVRGAVGTPQTLVRAARWIMVDNRP